MECFSYVVISYLIHLTTISIITYCNLMNNEDLSVEVERIIPCSHFLMWDRTWMSMQVLRFQRMRTNFSPKEVSNSTKRNTRSQPHCQRLIQFSSLGRYEMIQWLIDTRSSIIERIYHQRKKSSQPMFYTCRSIDCWFDSSLKNGGRIFYLPNLKGVGNRLQIFSGLYVLSYHYRIPIVSKITLLDTQN